MRIAAALVFAAVALAAPSSRAEVRGVLGGDYIFQNQGAFELMLAVDTPLARHVAVEGRFGGLLTTSSPTLGVPLDFGLRITPGNRLYLEGLIGPWIFFQGDAVRGHAGFGFGLEGRDVSFGVEVGTLSFSNGMVGARLGFRL